LKLTAGRLLAWFIVVTFVTFAAQPLLAQRGEVLQRTARELPAPVQTYRSVHDRLAPKEAIQHLVKGIEHTQRQQHSEAEASFREALNVYPDFDTAHAALGESLIAQERWDDAQHVAAHALDKAPTHPSLLRLMAAIQQHFKHYEESLKLLRRSLSVEPRNEPALSMLARAEYRTGDCPNAIVHARHAHEATLHLNPIVHLVSAACFESAAHLEDAKVEYEIFLREAPDDLAAEVIRRRIREIAAGN